MARDNILGLDPKNFTHVSSDKDKTILKHKLGHTLTIAHNVLSPKAKAQLSALANIPKDSETVSQKQEADAKMAKGGRVYHRDGDIDKTMEESQKLAHGSRDVSEHAESKMAAGGEAHELNETQVRPDKGYGKIIMINQHDENQPMAEGGEILHEEPVSDRIAQALGPVKRFVNKNTDRGPQPEKKTADDNVPNKDKYAKGGKIAKYCAYCGGMAHGGECKEENPKLEQSVKQPIESKSHIKDMRMYAEGDEVQSDIPPMLARQSEEPQTPEMPVEPKKEEPVESGAHKFGRQLRETIGSNYKVQAADKALHMVGNALQGAPAFIAGLTGAPEDQKAPAQNPRPVSPQQQVQNNINTMTAPTQDPVFAASQNMMEQGFQNQLAGITQEEKAKEQIGQANQQALNESVSSQEAAKIAFQNQLARLNDERQAMISDIQKGHIDPQQYWTGDENGNGSHSKIAAGLGMILAGFNPTNRPNAAIDFIKFQMDKNLEAQAKNLDSKNNLLRNNMEQFHNVKDAMDMTRLQQADLIHNQMLLAAANASTPMAKAEMLQKAGQLEQQFAPLKQQFALRQAMMQVSGMSGSNTAAAEHLLQYMRMLDPQQAKEMESRLVPGAGLAKVPVPEAVRSELVSHSKLDDAANDLLNFTKTHSTMVPFGKDYNIGAQKALVVQQMIREGMLGTVFRESEKPLLNKFVNENPAGALKMITTEPKLQQILQSSKAQADALKRAYGLPVQQQAPQQQPVKGKDGRMYIRQGNFMVPVSQ